jgi:hypothetical protein
MSESLSRVKENDCGGLRRKRKRTWLGMVRENRKSQNKPNDLQQRDSAPKPIFHQPKEKSVARNFISNQHTLL